jgi:hypothetical protein
MFELVDKNKLVKGEKYCVKRKRFLHSRHIKNFDCIFDRSDFERFVWVKRSILLDIELDLELNDFYRYVSKEEFYAKVKEKYDVKCLNIILKRLIDESFAW